MRYIKVFIGIMVFFLVMMFFVQNQASFSNPVVLRLDTVFWPPFESMPLPIYALMLICFALGALLVLGMLMWDRMFIAARASSAIRRASSLEKKLARVTAEAEEAEELAKLKEEKTQEEFNKKEAALKENVRQLEERLAVSSGM